MCIISETSPLSMGNAIPLQKIYNIAHLIIAMSKGGRSCGTTNATGGRFL
ncbi:MAG: hypothetical protein V7K79_25575 [Nostoc sp.]